MLMAKKNYKCEIQLTASCICSWDSSLHQLPTLNSSSSELIYAIVNVMLRLSFPFPMSIVLRKRICINIGGKIWPRWPRWQRVVLFLQPLLRIVLQENQAGTGLLCDIVACIPKAPFLPSNLISFSIFSRLRMSKIKKCLH